jgi:hypothetical protein
MVLTTNNLSSERIKNDFGEVDEAIFQGVQMPCEIIFCILGIEINEMDKVALYFLSRRMVLRTHNLPSESFKIDFGEVDESMFQGVELPCDSIFSIFGIVTNDLTEGA